MRLNVTIKKRVIASIVAVSATALALTGCSAGSDSSAGGSKTITFLSWDTQTVMQPMIDLYEKQNPGYKVDVSYAPPVPQYISKLQTMLSANDAPDVFIITAENKTQLMDNGLVKDLSGLSWTSNLADAARAAYTKDGKLYGSATGSWGGGILVNKDILAKYGFTTPPKTWDDFLAMCKKLKDDGINPFLEAGDGVPVTLAALIGVQNQKIGGDVTNKIWAGKTTFAKAWTPAIQDWYKMYSEGLVPRTVAGLTGDQVNQEFEQGQVAMMGTGSWGLSGVQQAAPNLKLEFWPVPSASGENFWCGAVNPGLAINAKSKNVAAAEKFLEFMQTKAAVQKYQDLTQSIMTTKDFTPSLNAALDLMVPDIRAGKFYLPAVDFPTNSDSMSTQATALLQQTIQGQISPLQFAQGLDQKLASVK